MAQRRSGILLRVPVFAGAGEGRRYAAESPVPGDEVKSLRSNHRRLKRIRAAWAEVHLVDRCLLLFMAVLLVQLACGLFLPEGLAPEAGSIDVIVRTSAAAIFGYLLSGNFNRGSEQEIAERTDSPPECLLEAQSDVISPLQGVQDPVGGPAGFPGEMVRERTEPSKPEKGVSSRDTGCLQILMATAIGLFCLAVLLLVRFSAWWGVPLISSDSATATVAQLRDFVSGSVGFLIGCPTCTLTQSKS